ncbi:Cna B-type domain-containing protein [Blautia luti]|uniref:Cna B-type domain-containing protein n=1 Tax=Blautia luti TaxID=89014 RepID=UPI00156E1F69|nr:Cna B-type domain-containing protein [Blautia luti]NSK84474.1 Cna B-type domain-containing protein [Blautia luti]
MSTKLHSGLKRTLAWLLTAAMLAQGCFVVSADDFSSEPAAAQETQADTQSDAEAVDFDTDAVETTESSDDVTSGEEEIAAPDVEQDADVEDISQEADSEELTAPETTDDNAAAEQNAFDDGSAVAAFSDGTDAQDVSDLKRDTGEIAITKNENYSYTRLYDEKGYIKLAVGTYPANNSTVTVKVGDKKGLQYRTLYTTSTQTDYKKASWSNCTSQNMGQYQYGVEWKSSNENVAKVVSNSQYGPYTTGVWVQGISEGTTTITSTWKPGSKFKDSDGNYTLGTVTNSFTVKVEKAADPVEVGTSFTLNGSPSSPFQVAREGSSAAKLYWGRTSSVNYSIPESTESFDNSGMTTCNASWGAWSDTGEITHAFCINYAEMIGGVLDSKKGAYDNSTYRESVSSYSPGGTTDVFLRPCKMPADGIYVTGTGGDRGSFVNNNVVFDRVSSNSYVYVYAYCIKNQQKVDSATFYSNIKWSSSDESVMKVARQDKYSVQLASYKAGIATLHGSYQPVDSEGNPDGEPLTIDVKVIVCGFYIDEKAEDGTNTIEMSLDDESITRKIQYKVIDSTGEAEPTDIISWSCDKPAIASVDSDGVVKAKAAGEATVTAQYGDSSTNKDTVKIIVKGAGSLGFDKAESKVKKGGTDTIKATATYNGSTVRNADIKWESENPAIATVDNGKITGISEGTTTVKASWTAENGKTYTNNATVKVVYDGLYLSDAQNEVTLAQKSTQEIVWQLLDMGEYSSGSTGEGYNTSSDVTWTSANEDLITVDSVGVITAKELPEGEEKAETTVSVSYKGNKVKDIKVTVVKNQAITTGTTTDVAGTKGETKTDKDGADKSNTWKTGAYKAGHGSLGSEFNSSANYLEIADGTGSTASVKGKSPSQGYAYLSHKYYIPLTTGQLCGVWQGIAVKVTGAAGLYLNKSSVSMKMGENNTATIQGTYITESGEEWGHWANEKHPDYSTIHMIDGDTNVVTAAPDPKNGSVLKLTAVAPGKTTITVQFDTSTLTATCDVEVTSDARLVLTPADKLRVVQGDTQTIEAKAWDGSAYVENPEITWQSYNTKIATVDDKGGVTGVKKGSVGVAATWNGITSDPVQVTVVPSRTLNVTTTWDDDNNRDGKRPEKTTLQLTTTDGENVGDPVELNADNEWKYTWKNLASEDEDGQHISYLVTAVEDDTLTANNYTAEVTRSSSDDEFVVTYKHEIEKTGITANVTWDDADNQDGIRPKEVTLQLKADGEAVGDAITVKADSNGNWTKTWSNLPVNKEGAVGQAIVYTVEESGLPDGYAPAVAIDEETGAITVKNSHTPAVKDLTVSAKWDDADNQDGVRPASVDTVLYAGDTATDKTVTLTAEENWTATIKDMPVYAAGKVGEAVNYSLKAAKEVEDYTSATDGLTLTFTHKAAVTAVTATITWDDAENQDGIRPDSVTLQLKADGESVGSRITVDGTNDKWTKTWDNLPVNKAGKKVTYTVEQTGLRSEYTQATAGDAATGFTITNSYTPKGVDIAVSANWDDQDNQDGIRPEAVEAELYADNVSTNKKVRLTADTDWKATFEKLAVNKNGKPINYTLQATKVEGYDLTTEGSGADGLVLKYTHKVKAVDVTATVKWADGENQDGIRPNTVNLQLKADGENVGDAIVVNANSNWTKTWSGLAEYKAGKKVTYTVEATGIRSEYKVEITGDAATGFTVTATHVPAKAEVKASVVWDDADNQDGIRPEAVEAEIYAGDVSNSKKVRLTAENNWTASFGEMELKKDGQEIKYTLVGTKADGYTYTCTGSGAAGLVLTYTHKPEVVSVSVNTTWNDKNNQDGQRPGSYSVQLKADGEATGDVITLNSSNSFAKVWKDLPKYKAGKVGEAVKYEVAVSGLPENYETRTEADGNTFNVINTYIPETVQIPVSVKWDDANNQDGKRLDSVEAELYADGQATGNKVTLDEKNSWKASFAKVDVKKDGKRINYTVKTTENKDYTITTTGNVLDDNGVVVTYKHVPETVNVSIKSAWNDANNQDGIRPATISVQLMKDDKEEGDNINLKIASSKTWSNLPKYANGKEIKYAVAISDVSGYTKKVTGSVADGYVAAFTHSVYKTSVVVQNTWSDLDNALLTRPSSLTVQIYANGKATSKKVVLNSANKWKATVSGLNKNSAGKKIAYSAKLVKTPTGYKVTIGSISSKGTIAIKNTYTKFTKKLTVKISPTKVTYNGKTRKPAVKSVYYGKTKLSSSYYTVSFKNNKNPGIGSVIVKGKGKYAKYAGSATFSILPKAPTGLTAKSTAKKQATVTWKGSTGATGYQIMISQKSDFRKGTTRTFTIRDSKRRSGVPKPMTSGRTYYIRIRSYKTTSNGKTVYSAWSKSTKTKIK